MKNYIELPLRACKGADSPTVQDLINGLNKIEDKNQPVFGYLIDKMKEKNTDQIELKGIDNSIEDRVDLNFEIQKYENINTKR